MKRFFYILVLLGLIATSCEKDPVSGESKGPIVSISSDNSFNAENIAKLTISLSAASDKVVVVNLMKFDVQSGKTNVPVTYTKKVSIPAGETKAVIDVEVDVLGLESGDYQSAIKIESAENAKVGDNNTVYINLQYAFKPTVNLYADPFFSDDKTVKLKAALSKATTVPVIVNLETGSESKVSLEYENKITIPAGETEAEIVVLVDIPEEIVPGVYPAFINISTIENGVKGTVSSVKVDLSYPFAVTISIDGDFDDWENPNVTSWSLPEGDVLYESIKKLKLTSNQKYVYMYLEFYDPGFDFNMPFNLYVDADGDPGTGAIVASVDNDTFYPPYDEEHMGLEYYIELSMHDADHYNDFYSWGGIYQYTGEDRANVFSGLKNLSGTYDGSVIYATGELDSNNIGRVEIQMLRSWFGIKGNKARFAVKIMDGANNWSAIGLLPQGNVVDGVRTHVDMATLYLPNFVE